MEDINNQYLSVNIGIPDVKNLAGWATFVAIIDIIIGAISCFGIITAAYGVPQILSGVKLLNAAEDMKRSISINDTQRITDIFINLNKYFKFNGISIIIKICFGVLFLLLYGVLIAYLILHMPDYMNKFPGYTF